MRPAPLPPDESPGPLFHAWIPRIRAGDEEAFNAYYREYGPRLFRYLLACCPGDEALVNDALQEALLRILKHLAPKPDAAAFWNWQARIARSALADLRRKHRRHAARSGRWADENLPAPDAAEERWEQHLAAVLDTLSPEERDLVEAVYFQRRAQEAIAETMGLSRKAVESRIARIRKKLRSLLIEKARRETI